MAQIMRIQHSTLPKARAHKYRVLCHKLSHWKLFSLLQRHCSARQAAAEKQCDRSSCHCVVLLPAPENKDASLRMQSTANATQCGIHSLIHSWYAFDGYWCSYQQVAGDNNTTSIYTSRYTSSRHAVSWHWRLTHWIWAHNL